MRKIITSESVNIGHPDKTCDYIADSILDEALKQDPNSQMAVECAIKSNLLMIYGEATTKAKLDYKKIARECLSEIGYTNRFKIITKITEQSPDINQAVVKPNELTANDQGMVYGYACNETPELMPLPITIAHKLMRDFNKFRLNIDYFADAKSQVSIEYEGDKPIAIDTILLSVSHNKDVSHERIQSDMQNFVIEPVLEEYKDLLTENTKFIINPSGKFTIWGSYGDSGCVGRKIVVDTYGGVGRVGGGCFSSKNPTKVDRSGAYYARYVAKNIVAHKLATSCEIQVSYGIGIAEPISLHIEAVGLAEGLTMEQLYDIVNKNFDFSVGNIIKELGLQKPIYKNTACFGHFGREEFSWEKVKVIDLGKSKLK